MKSFVKKNLLLINGYGSPRIIIDELISKISTDSNIYLSYPVAVLTLAGWCKQEFPNFNIKIIDAPMEIHKHFSKIESKAINFSEFNARMLEETGFVPDYIGISISISNGHIPCLQLCKFMKEIWPDSKIIAGGVHTTTFPHRIINEPGIDYIVRGPGDIAFVELLDSLIKEKSPEQIPGVVTGIDNIHKMAIPFHNLDDIPPYPYDMIDMEYLVVNESTSPIHEKGARTGMIFISRGCPFGCTFCSADKVHGKKVFYKSASKMVDEIEYLINTYHVNSISILDDLFGANKKQFFDFFRIIEDRGLNFNLIVPTLSIKIFNEEMIDVLVKHGLKVTFFPVESGSKFVQENIIKKNIDLDKAIRLIEYSKKKGVFSGANIVIGSPGETREMMMETRDFVKDLPADAIAFFVAYPYPGTEMTNILLERGSLTENSLIEVWNTSTQGFKTRPFDTIEISGKELSDLVYDFNIDINFFSNFNMRNQNYKNPIIRFNKIIDRYPFHIVALACRARCYYEIGQTDIAVDDVKSIFTLIKENSESQKLFNRYEKRILEMVDFSDTSLYQDL